MIPVVLQLVLPIVLLGWLWWRRPVGRADWLLGVLLVAGVILAISRVVPWLAVPHVAGTTYLATALGLAVRSWYVADSPAAGPVGRTRRRLRQTAIAAVAAAAWGIVLLAVLARQPGAGAVFDLACPLEPGRYLVAAGGSRLIVNPHLATLADDPRFDAWRGQSYGVDLVATDAAGRRAARIGSDERDDYLVYGRTVVAPCTGRVVATANARPDMPVGERDADRTQLAGNHVVVACEGIEVLLAHLQSGSVRVTGGEPVRTGQPVGLAGNSGNTDEPHLHVSAQRPGPGAARFDGQPVWIRIAGRFPVRNDVVVCR